MKNIIFILIFAISVFFCNAQKNERFELNNKNTSTTISECDDVSNLQYYQKGSSINLSWDVPGQIDLSHSDDFDGDAIGSSLDFTVGHKFEPEDLEDYVGYKIIKISFVPNEEGQCIYTAKVWKETKGVLEVVASQPVEHFEPKECTTVTLLEPIIIDDISTYFFGYNVKNGTFPAGVDEGPAIVGKGDLCYNSTHGWVSVYEQTGGSIDCNFCIKAEIIPDSSENFPIGYNVLRNDTLLNYVTLSAYKDENVYIGEHEYCVEAVYYNCYSKYECISVDVEYSSVETQKSEFSIYPNPANNYLNIVGGNFNAVKIYNSIGKLVGVYDYTTKIDISKYPRGLYIVEIINGSRIHREKIIKR